MKKYKKYLVEETKDKKLAKEIKRRTGLDVELDSKLIKYSFSIRSDIMEIDRNEESKIANEIAKMFGVHPVYVDLDVGGHLEVEIYTEKF